MVELWSSQVYLLFSIFLETKRCIYVPNFKSFFYADESSQAEEQLELNILSKRKAKNLSVEDHEQNVNIVSDASGLKQSKRRAKQSPVEAKIEVNTEIINEKEKPSIKNKEASGTLKHSSFYPNDARVSTVFVSASVDFVTQSHTLLTEFTIEICLCC